MTVDEFIGFILWFTRKQCFVVVVLICVFSVAVSFPSLCCALSSQCIILYEEKMMVVNLLASSAALFRQGPMLCSFHCWCVCCVPGCFVSLCFTLSSWCIILYWDRLMAVVSLRYVEDLVEFLLFHEWSMLLMSLFCWWHGCGAWIYADGFVHCVGFESGGSVRVNASLTLEMGKFIQDACVVVNLLFCSQRSWFCWISPGCSAS